MWCRNCRQDVPCVGSGEEGKLRCLRCDGPLEKSPRAVNLDPPELPPSSEEAVASANHGAGEPSALDNWEMEEELRHLGRKLGCDRDCPETPQDAQPPEFGRVESGHEGPSGWHRGEAAKPAGQPVRGFSLAVLVAWLAASLGMMAFVCGGVLVAWSLIADRPELWNLGLPLALGGQLALLLGLLLQLDRMRQDNRQAASKLDNVDEQLHDLRTTTTMLGTSHNSPGGAFYSHLAGGASPHLLLSDLKGQLDLLAVKIEQMQRR